MIASWSKTIQSVLDCGPRVLFLPTKQSARPIYSHDNATWKSSIQCSWKWPGPGHIYAESLVCSAVLHSLTSLPPQPPAQDVHFASLPSFLLIKGSTERSRHERHFCSLLPYFLLSWLQIFQLCLSLLTSSFDLDLFKKFPSGKERYPKNLPKRLSSWHLHSCVNRSETWYTASAYPSAKHFVTEFLISLWKSRYGWNTSKNAVLPYPVGFDEA